MVSVEEKVDAPVTPRVPSSCVAPASTHNAMFAPETVADGAPSMYKVAVFATVAVPPVIVGALRKSVPRSG